MTSLNVCVVHFALVRWVVGQASFGQSLWKILLSPVGRSRIGKTFALSLFAVVCNKVPMNGVTSDIRPFFVRTGMKHFSHFGVKFT